MLLYNNGCLVLTFTKLLLTKKKKKTFYEADSYYLVFAIFTLFNLSSSSTIVFLVQFFISSNHYLKFFI